MSNQLVPHLRQRIAELQAENSELRGVLGSVTPLSFKGFWDDGDQDQHPAPWETFRVWLYGEEAGDYADEAEQVDQVLKASGYRLVLIEDRQSKPTATEV